MTPSVPFDGRRAVVALALVAMLVVAGCTATQPTADPAGAATPADGEDTTADGHGASTDGESAGGVAFYVSDRPAAIDDFAHLNVTVTRVGFQRVGGNDSENESADGEWLEYDVENRTVDLTRLQGAKAERIADLDVPNGTYGKVFAYVSEVNGTLVDGSDQRVKLPSGKLHLNGPYHLGAEPTKFVFDIAVHEAGKSGKYILRPVVSESGTDVPVEDVDEDSEDGSESDGSAGDGSGEGSADSRRDGNETR